MRKVLEAQARTADEAIQQVLQRLGAPSEEVAIEVLEEGSETAMGIRPARVRVTHDPALKSSSEACSIVIEILRRMDIDAKATARSEDGKIFVSIASEEGGLLIGRGGRNIDALQHIVNRILNRGAKDRATVVLDTEDYRNRRQTSLEDMAYRAADRVRDTGRRVILPEMNPHDRRIIHLALRDDRDVETESEGDGFLKRIYVLPVSNGRGRR